MGSRRPSPAWRRGRGGALQKMRRFDYSLYLIIKRRSMLLSCETLVSSAPWWFEPALATAAFAGHMLVFRACELGYGLSEALSEMACGPLRVAASTAGVAGMAKPHAHTGHAFDAAGAYWLGILLWTAVVSPPRGAETGCPSDAASLAAVVVELVAGVVLYDFVFFWLHWSMHAWPGLGRTLGHGTHHGVDGDDERGAFQTVNHSVADGALQVLTNIVAQRHTPWGTPKRTLARWLHNVVTTWLLVESHTTAPQLRLARRLPWLRVQLVGKETPPAAYGPSLARRSAHPPEPTPMLAFLRAGFRACEGTTCTTGTAALRISSFLATSTGWSPGGGGSPEEALHPKSWIRPLFGSRRHVDARKQSIVLCTKMHGRHDTTHPTSCPTSF